MRINVVIPIVNQDLAYGLLGSIARNSLPPANILIIDNTPSKEKFRVPKCIEVPVEIFKPCTPWKVNRSWQHGLDRSSNYDAVSILNDDIILNENFFERTARVLAIDGVGVSCPYTVPSINQLMAYPMDQHDIRGMRKREGWAFTLSREALSVIPSIPYHIFQTFYGDDWIYFHTAKKRIFEWKRDLKNMAWHKGGVTVRAQGLHRDLKPEKLKYGEYMLALAKAEIQEVSK